MTAVNLTSKSIFIKNYTPKNFSLYRPSKTGIWKTRKFHQNVYGVQVRGTIFEIPANSILLEILSSGIPIDAWLLLDQNIFSK